MLNNQFSLTNSIQAIDAKITALQSELIKLEEQKSVLYQTEEVCIQAVEAVNKAVAVLHEVAGPEQVANFGKYLAAKFAEFITPALESESVPAPDVTALGRLMSFESHVDAALAMHTPEASQPEAMPAVAPEVSQPEAEASPEVKFESAPEIDEKGVEIELSPEVEFESAPEPALAPEASEPEAQAQTATLAELKALSIQKIRKLATKKNVGGSGTRAEIAAKLAGLVTTAELKLLA